MQFFDHVRIDMTDIIAVLFIFLYLICKFNHIDTYIDAALAMVIAFYFGSKHQAHNKK